MNLPIIFLILGIALFRGATSSPVERKESVKLTLFYESYCPYSIQFVVNQLYKTWGEFKDHMQLDLVPFGNAKQSYEDGHFVFTCQHGPKECVGNILHACAIDQACDGKSTLHCPVDQLTKAMDYINCVMQQSDQRAASNQCASQSGLKPKEINKCATGTRGEILESGYRNQTDAFDKPKIIFVPFILINNKYDEKQEEAARSDLRTVICMHIPDQCA